MQFLLVYIREAHPTDSNWPDDSIQLNDPRTLHERLSAASLCGEKLDLTLPTVVDDLDDKANQMYSAWPERIYIVSQGGIIHYRGGLGPWGCKTEEAEASLITLLS